MELVEEYRLSEYQDFGMLTDKEQVHIVRNRVNGQIAVRKIVSSDRLQIYAFLQKIQIRFFRLFMNVFSKRMS